MAAVEVEQSLLAINQGAGGIAGLLPAAERNPKRVRSEFQLSDLKADSCVTSTATLAQSTKMNAMCKRGR
jgi:hypothetical protein